MKRLAPIAVLLLALPASAQLTARGIVGYESRVTNDATISGMRQTYDLRLDKALTGNSHFALFFRDDDFRGDSVTRFVSQRTGTRELRPGGELVIDTSNVLASLRAERFDTRSRANATNRRLDRSTANVQWSPIDFPTWRVLAERNTTSDAASSLRLNETLFAASTNYTWKGIVAGAEQRLMNSTDERAGYTRKSSLQTYNLGYTANAFGGKLSASLDTTAQLSDFDETATSGAAASVPTPVQIVRALYAIDDTPLDGRDHPPLPNPALIDSVQNISSGISLGADSVSFQNIVLDLGRVDRVDEVRIYVRDASMGPLRNGGGAVTFDAYTSEDGNIWTSVPSSTAFLDSFSAYSVTFAQLTGRWFKVVSFGVNGDATFVTEVQTYYHTSIGAGDHRKGTQKTYSGNASLLYRPVKKLTMTYTGLYSTVKQVLTSQPLESTRDIEHLVGVQYDAKSWLDFRTQIIRRTLSDQLNGNDGADEFNVFADYVPTARLRITLESGLQRQTLASSPSTIRTEAIHATGFLLRSVQVSLDGGVQTQQIGSDGSTAHRTFATLSANVQLTRTLRMLLGGNLQRTKSDSTDPAVQLLGATRDNRITDEFLWRPGQQLALSVRFGWVSGVALSTFTQRYHVEWFPFSGGTVSLASSYDEDIDATTNRRAKRLIFNPRWQMNRWVILDLNYTSVRTQLDMFTNRQRALLATVSVIK